MPPRNKSLLQETHDTVIELRTTLIGANGDEGVVGEIKQLRKDHHKFEEKNTADHRDIYNKHDKLNQRFWTVIGILIGSGILGSAIYNLMSP